jgi:hypothetical protein
VEADGTTGLIEELSAKLGTDVDGARKVLMDTLGGILIGRPAKRGKRRTLSPSWRLRVPPLSPGWNMPSTAEPSPRPNRPAVSRFGTITSSRQQTIASGANEGPF